MKVVLDTNFLLLPFQFKIDVLEEVQKCLDSTAQFVVLSSCESEALSLPLLQRRQAKTMIDAVKKKGGVIENTGQGKPDEKIYQYALENKNSCAVCTNDSLLRNRLKKAGIKTIFLRAKSTLKIE